MKSKLLILTILVLIAMMAAPTPAYAYPSVTGNVIDSKISDPWAWGGEVWVQDSSGNICGTGTLDSNGTFSIVLDGSQDDLAWGTTVDCTQASYSGQILEVIIDFDCFMDSTNCTDDGLGNPVDRPGTNSITFTQSGLPFPWNIRDIETDTGPNAIELVDFSVTPQSNGNTCP